MITIPDRLSRKAANFDRGRQWLEELPAICRRLSVEWSVDLGAPFADCHVSLVLHVTRDAQPLVLKLPLPSTIDLGTLPAGARANEAAVLREWAGQGAVRLIEHDPSTEAMLVE